MEGERTAGDEMIAQGSGGHERFGFHLKCNGKSLTVFSGKGHPLTHV